MNKNVKIVIFNLRWIISWMVLEELVSLLESLLEEELFVFEFFLGLVSIGEGVGDGDWKNFNGSRIWLIW